MFVCTTTSRALEQSHQQGVCDMLWNILLKVGLGLVASVLGSAAMADALDEVKKRGELVIGMEAQYVPYEFFKDGQIIGYDVDILNKFGEKLGVKVKLVDTEWNGIIPALLAKKVRRNPIGDDDHKRARAKAEFRNALCRGHQRRPGSGQRRFN